MGKNEDDPSFICYSESPPILKGLEGFTELSLQNKEAADYTMAKQNEDAQTGTDDCNIEKTGSAVLLVGKNEDNPSFICYSESPPTLKGLKGFTELSLQNKEAADYTMAKQNEDAQTGTNDCNIEETGSAVALMGKNQDLKGFAEFSLHYKEASDYTMPKQNEDAQTGTDICDIEITGDDISDPDSEPMIEYMLVDDFIFSEKSLVGRFTRMNPTLQELSEWSSKHWKPKLSSDWMFKIMAEGFFKIEFFFEDDCEFVLENGPWFMGVAGLTLKRWSPDFDPKNPGELKTPIWMRLLSLPLEFWNEGMLINICSVVGKVLKIAEPYKKGSKESLTRRVCVEVDLNEELKSAIILKKDNYSRKQPLDYEGIPFRCKVCHGTDHLEESCPKTSRKNTRNKNGHISNTLQNMNMS